MYIYVNILFGDIIYVCVRALTFCVFRYTHRYRYIDADIDSYIRNTSLLIG